MDEINSARNIKRKGEPIFDLTSGLRRRNMVWTVAISALLVVLLATVASGRLSGLGQFAISTSKPANSVGNGLGNGTPAAKGQTASTTNQTSVGPLGSLGGSLPQSSSVQLPVWLLYLVVATATATGLFFVLRRRLPADTYDFKAALEQLEKERSALEWSWSYKLRNAALLRYYSIVRMLCSKLGVEEKPSETPREFLEKATSELKLESGEALRFVEAFNRARYGVELSQDEAKEAAAYMGAFVDSLRRSLGLGS